MKTPPKRETKVTAKVEVKTGNQPTKDQLKKGELHPYYQAFYVKCACDTK